MTPLEYLGGDQIDQIDGTSWRFRLPRAIHGAFGGVTGGALAAAAVAAGRASAPGRIAVSLDMHFLRGLATEDATASIEVLSSGRSLTVVRAELSDDSGRRTTVARIGFAEPTALEPIDSDAPAGQLGPPAPDLDETSRPWRPPRGVEIPIIETARPRAARLGDAIATLVTIPWDPDGDGAEGACLAADLSVGPPVDAVLPKGTWVPHPNPDVSIRFAGPVTSSDLVAVATCRRVARGAATVESEVWDGAQLVASAISTSLFMAAK
ncbi:MAG: thioesterase family protein [Actinomycetia bacterium]|nr:thioesterase family protein [Actinomycetes bacterium]MCP4223430.1 thioesterase family protein [Actinomycetes bacterium]